MKGFQNVVMFYCEKLLFEEWFLSWYSFSMEYYQISLWQYMTINILNGAGTFEWPGQTTEDVYAVSTVFLFNSNETFRIT